MSKGLWAFATQWYARPGVEAACLALQAGGADVCLVLCAAWLGQQGVACTPERCEALRMIAAPWQENVVVPLRSVRHGWKAGAQSDTTWAALREQLKLLEIQAEQALLARLEATTQAWPTGGAQTLEPWLASCLEGLDAQALQALLSAT